MDRARPSMQEGELPHVYVMRGMHDADVFKARVDAIVARTGRVGHAVVMGAGFVGLEFAEQLVRRGLHTSVVEFKASILPAALDPEMVRGVEDDLRCSGVELYLGVAAESIKLAVGSSVDDGGMTVRLSTGIEVPADIVLLVRSPFCCQCGRKKQLSPRLSSHPLRRLGCGLNHHSPAPPD